MTYSSVGLLALIIQVFINYDVLALRPGREDMPAYRSYRSYLVAVTMYYFADALWGILYEHHLTSLVSLDTSLYFIAMAASILLWARFVVSYLGEERLFGRVLEATGLLIFALQVLAVAINFFVPVLFSFDASGAYHAESVRYVTLGLQTAMFSLTSLYALLAAAHSDGAVSKRYRAIGLSSLMLAGFAVFQVLYPLLPMYCIGCLLSCCVLHGFVLQSEKDEYLEELEEKVRSGVEQGNYFDLLTELPGMTYFFELAQARRAEMLAAGQTPAFLFLDLSGMKFYNQYHGFSEGDKLLKRLANKLSEEFDSSACSRFGQDHFVVLTQADGIDAKLQNVFRAWDSGDERDLPGIRVGVYVDEVEGISVSAACDRAKAARDTIRNAYVSSVRYFDASMLTSTESQLYVVSHIDQALSEGWVQVYYQPIVRAVNGRVCDEEALARWVDPERGFLSPADFVPALENANLVYKLDLYVLEQVLKKMLEQERFGLQVVPHSVNLSRADFDACDMVEEIRRRVDAAGVGRDKITIEITETIIGSDFDFMKEQIERFQTLGFAVWMDDFGSGYSSLDVLQSVRFDLLKFDMSFMKKLDQGEQGRIVLTELMRMATSLGLDTVCEGVETEAQVKFLQEIGCSKLQGYYFTPPISLEQLLERYEQGRQIGFEDTAATAYYETVGRTSLYDLTAIVSESGDALTNFFDSLPMAVLEVDGNGTRVTRCNQPYRDFMLHMFKYDMAAQTVEQGIATPGAGQAFVRLLWQCCQIEDRVFLDEPMPNGSTVHSVVRRIAINPVTGTTALVVAVLSVTEVGEEANYADIARILASDYYNLYYVDLKTEAYIEYSAPTEGHGLAVERRGDDFFNMSQHEAGARLYDEDREMFLTSFTRENIVRALDERGVFELVYRLNDAGTPMRVHLKAVRMQSTGTDDHIIIGVRSAE